MYNDRSLFENLIDKSGQLKLRTPLNLFIGGQILDQGITFGNLIGFYYGRKPQKLQDISAVFSKFVANITDTGTKTILNCFCARYSFNMVAFK